MRPDQIRELIERLRAVGKDETLLAEVWAVLDDFEVSILTQHRELDALRARLGEGGVRGVVPVYVAFHRRLLDEQLA